MLGTLLAAITSGETLSTLQRLKQASAAYAAAAVLSLLALLFLIFAAYAWVARSWGPVAGALLFAGVFLVAAVLVLAAHRWRARAQAKRAAQRRSGELLTMGVLSAVAGAPSLVRGRKAKAGMAAVLLPVAAAVLYAGYRHLFNREPKQPT